MSQREFTEKTLALSALTHKSLKEQLSKTTTPPLFRKQWE